MPAVRQCALGRIFNQSNQIIHVTFMAGANKICLFDLPSHAAGEKKTAVYIRISMFSMQWTDSNISLPPVPFYYVHNNKGVLLHQFKNRVASADCLRSREAQLILKQKGLTCIHICQRRRQFFILICSN
jgi:hypothetical protein